MKLPFVTRSAYDAVRALAASEQAAKVRAERRAADAEQRYHELVARLTERALPAPAVIPPPVAPLDPDVQTVKRLDDEVIRRMADSFVEHEKLTPEAALQHARELAQAAEAMYLGG